MSIETIKIERFLIDIHKVLTHQREIEKLKGEHFNVFSVLGFERRENRTHSAFLFELLNPKGSHLKGTTFLELFLYQMNLIDHIDVKSAFVLKEHSIGKINYEKVEGGRIDLFISDKNSNSICIENKIDADDQYKQLERYSNHNKSKNKIIYLNLHGTMPSDDSKGGLKIDIDFQVFSYKTDIAKWLEVCIKESTDIPILRETIKQYLILIKKITNTMDAQHEKEINSLILSHYEESKLIASKVHYIKSIIGEEIRQAVFVLLKEKINGKYKISEGEKASKLYSQIWIRFTDLPNAPLFFGIQSFSGLDYWFDGAFFVGVFDQTGGKNSFAELDNNSKSSLWWVDTCLLKPIDDVEVNFTKTETLKKLYSDNHFKEKFVQHIVDQTVEYIDRKSPALIKFLKENNTTQL